MLNRNLKGRWFFIIAAVMLITASVFVIRGTRQQHSGEKQQPTKTQSTKDWLTSVPPVSSEVEELEIINARIMRAGTDAAGVAFEIRNNSHKGVTAVSITCGGPSISTDGLEDEDNPALAVQPYGTLTAEMNGELTPGSPISIDAAIFDDGTEKGSETTLLFLHKFRIREQARHRAEKKRSS
jgi:hypothetical protein